MVLEPNQTGQTEVEVEVKEKKDIHAAKLRMLNGGISVISCGH